MFERFLSLVFVTEAIISPIAIPDPGLSRLRGYGSKCRALWIFTFESSYFSFIVIKQSSEDGLALNGPDLRRQTDGNRVVLGVQGPIIQPLMGSQSIVVVNVVVPDKPHHPHAD